MHKYLKMGAFLSAAMLLVVLAVPAFAEENGTKNVKQVEKKTEQLVKAAAKAGALAEWKISDNDRAAMIRENGEFVAHGVVVNSVNASANMLNVGFMGFSRDVSVAGAKLIGAGKDITLADFKAGDRLNGKGMFDASSRSITVKEVHNLSVRKDVSGIEARIAELLKMVQDLQEKLKSLR